MQARSQDLVSRGANICSGGPLGVGPSPPLEVGPLPLPFPLIPSPPFPSTSLPFPSLPSPPHKATLQIHRRLGLLVSGDTKPLSEFQRKHWQRGRQN